MRLSKFNEIIKCGDVLHPLDCENEKFVEWISYEIPDECKECKILPICMGGCPVLRSVYDLLNCPNPDLLDCPPID